MMRVLPDVFKLDRAWNDRILYATEEQWPRINPHIDDKLMYKKPDAHSKIYEFKGFKIISAEDHHKLMEDQLAAVRKMVDDQWKEELTRQENELINEEYTMQYNENVRMRIDYEKMAAPYCKPSETKKKNPVFLRIDIKNVIFNPPATIVFWSDNTKTVVKAQNDEPYDPEKGLTMAICKKVYGNEGNYFNKIKKWTEPAYEELEEQAKFEKTLDEFFKNMFAVGAAKKHEEVQEPPIVTLNKDICKHCIKGAPYGDCRHLELYCTNYDMFEDVFGSNGNDN